MTCTRDEHAVTIRERGARSSFPVNHLHQPEGMIYNRLSTLVPNFPLLDRNVMYK